MYARRLCYFNVFYNRAIKPKAVFSDSTCDALTSTLHLCHGVLHSIRHAQTAVSQKGLEVEKQNTTCTGLLFIE